MSTHIIKTIPIPISNLQLLIPDLNIRNWLLRGITTLADITIGPAIKTFIAIQLEYGLESKDLYTYNQIAHFLSAIPTPFFSIPIKTYLYLTNPTTSIKGISLFYKLLNQKSVLSISPSMKSWEIDLKSSYSTEQN